MPDMPAQFAQKQGCFVAAMPPGAHQLNGPMQARPQPAALQACVDQQGQWSHAGEAYQQGQTQPHPVQQQIAVSLPVRDQSMPKPKETCHAVTDTKVAIPAQLCAWGVSGLGMGPIPYYAAPLGDAMPAEEERAGTLKETSKPRKGTWSQGTQLKDPYGECATGGASRTAGAYPEAREERTSSAFATSASPPWRRGRNAEAGHPSGESMERARGRRNGGNGTRGGGAHGFGPAGKRRGEGGGPGDPSHPVVDGPDTMKGQLQALQEEDPATVFIVRRINKLGFSSAQLLRKHFERYDHVKHVYVSHSRVKSVQSGDRRLQAGARWRLRAAALGFVVMYSPEATARILSDGPEIDVAGCTVNVSGFYSQRGPNAILHVSSLQEGFNDSLGTTGASSDRRGFNCYSPGAGADSTGGTGGTSTCNLGDASGGCGGCFENYGNVTSWSNAGGYESDPDAGFNDPYGNAQNMYPCVAGTPAPAVAPHSNMMFEGQVLPQQQHMQLQQQQQQGGQKCPSEDPRFFSLWAA